MRVKQNDLAALSIKEEGEYFVLNPLTKKIHRINAVGRFIWEACKEPRNTDELASVVAEHFKISLEISQRDVEAFVLRMVNFGLLEEV